jgi:hypothetical protein
MGGDDYERAVSMTLAHISESWSLPIPMVMFAIIVTMPWPIAAESDLILPLTPTEESNINRQKALIGI